jgi:hypothetical protein
MSCDLVRGRDDLQCKDNLSGVSHAYLMNFIEDGFTIANGAVTAIDVGITEAFKFELRNDTNVFTETKSESGRETGVTLFEQSLVLALKKIDKDLADTVKLIAKGRFYAVVRDRNGNWRLAGLTEGLDSTIEGTTGAARTDFSGYTITATNMEADPAPFLDSATITALEALVVSNTPSV